MARHQSEPWAVVALDGGWKRRVNVLLQREELEVVRETGASVCHRDERGAAHAAQATLCGRRVRGLTSSNGHGKGSRESRSSTAAPLSPRASHMATTW